VILKTDMPQRKQARLLSLSAHAATAVCVALFVGFSDDGRLFVLVLILFVFFVLLLLIIIVVVRISRRWRIADKRPVDQPDGNVLGDVRSHVSAPVWMWDVHGDIKLN
jgi:hypothetical protein